MRINPLKRARPHPLDGITFSDAEVREASEIARRWTPQMPLADARIIMTALGHEINRLEAASGWIGQSDSAQWLRLLRRTFLLYRAAEMTTARIDE